MPLYEEALSFAFGIVTHRDNVVVDTLTYKIRANTKVFAPPEFVGNGA